MPEVGLVAEFRVKPADVEQFLAAAMRELRAVRSDEPGCARFDVVVFDEAVGHGAFVEVFRDETAAETHRQTPHFKAFFEEISDLNVEWSTHRGRALTPG